MAPVVLDELVLGAINRSAMKRIDLWAYLNGVEMDFSRPGKPAVNPFIEGFNGGGFQRAIPARVPGRELGSVHGGRCREGGILAKTLQWR